MGSRGISPVHKACTGIDLRMMVTVDIKNLVCCGEKHRTADFKNTDGMRDVTQFFRFTWKRHFLEE